MCIFANIAFPILCIQNITLSPQPKLKQLMEMNAEELARLQRQAAREIECYKLELFSKMNKEFKNQANAIRETERQRAEQVQRDWLSKVEEVRRHHCAEMEKTTKEHKQWMRMQKQQHEIDKERIIHKHETDMKDAEAAHKTRMEQVTMQHERDLASLEIEHNDQVRNRKEEIKRYNDPSFCRLLCVIKCIASNIYVCL